MKYKNQRPDLELTLCSKCAGVYYDDRNYFIERTDLTQVVYEECVMCRNPHGYDFKIWAKATLQSKKSHHCGGDRK